jgi:hypothetical protein
MAQYGEVRVDFITYTTGVAPNEGNVTVPVSGLINTPTFSGDVNINGALNVSGLSTFSGITVTGDATVEGNLNVSGDINASGVTISGITGLFASGTAAAPSISFVDDTDTGIYSSGANQVALATNGTGRLFVDSVGNVGIGVTSAQTELHVGGSGQQDILIGSTNAGGARLVLDGDSNGDASGGDFAEIVHTTGGHLEIRARNPADDATMRFEVDAGEAMRITSNGRLGVGTSSPQSIVDISQTNGGDIYITNPTNYGTTPGINPTNRTSNGISWRGNINTGFGSVSTIRETNFIRSVLEDTSTGNSATQGRYALTFGTASGGSGVSQAVERVRIDYLGRVGIGTTSPADMFHVQTNATGRLLIGPNGSSNFHNKIYNDNGDLLISSEGSASDMIVGSNRNIIFRTGGVDSGDEAARIDSSGRLLVGTSSARRVGSTTFPLSLYESTTHTILAVVANNVSGGTLCLGGTGGSSIGSNTLVSDNQTIGGIRFAAADGADLQSDCARIFAQIDGTPDANDVPGRLVFSTTANGASSPTERARLTSDGELLVGTTTESNLNVQVHANAMRIGSFFVGNVHDTTNSNNRTVLVHRMDSGSNEGFMFSGHFIVQSYTGNAYINVHITKKYTSDAVEVDLISATRSAQISKTNVRVVTADYGSARYLGFQKNGGGTGTSHINAFLGGNLHNHGGVREVDNSSLGSVTEIAKLNY